MALDGSDRRLELHVVPAVADAGMSDRAARLCAVRHEHLPQVLDVVELSSGRLGLVVEHVDGLSLAQIRAARAPLTDGEAATVAIPVAGALAALHAAGLSHGAVSESTVVVRPDGRPVLTDLRGALAGAADTEADVRRLVATVLDQMPGADVHPSPTRRDGGACGRPSPVCSVPGLDADRVVDACYDTADPEPVRLPDAGARASSALTAMAREGGPAERGVTRRQDRERRRRRAARFGGSGDRRGGAGGRRRGMAPPGPQPEAAPGADDPVQAAIELSRVRAEIIGTGDASLLDTVDVADGPASVADRSCSRGLDGVRVDGLTSTCGTRGSSRTTEAGVTRRTSP